MHYIYLIHSVKDKYSYIGSTANLEKRLDRHNQGHVISTREHAPFVLIYYEAFLDKQDAIERESKLKHHGSAVGHLKRRLKNSLRQMISPKGRDQFD